jgi:hypothetical protein
VEDVYMPSLVNIPVSKAVVLRNDSEAGFSRFR